MGRPRKNKDEPIAEPVETPVTPTVTAPNSNSDTTSIPLVNQQFEREQTYIVHKEIAQNQIDRCNWFIWGGFDNAYGRIFEASRKEWCEYMIKLIDWLEGKRTDLPKAPDIEEEP